MPDIDHTWGGDLVVGPTGDLAVVDGTQRGIERVVRRLMTRGAQAATVNSPALTGEMAFHQSYGASVPQRIGQTIDIPLITSVIRAQILLEDVVAESPAPVISVTPFLNGVVVDIAYSDAVTGKQTSLSFDVNR